MTALLMDLLILMQCLVLLAGAGFFLTGTLGLLRFPDTYTRIHALTKVDNLGLGLIVLGLLPSAGGVLAALKLILVWLLALGASATVGHLVANARYRADAAAQRPDPDPSPEAGQA